MFTDSDKTVEEIYSTAAEDSSELGETSFFEDTSIYWEPANDSGTIYDQLAKKKFREIIRSQIE